MTRFEDLTDCKFGLLRVIGRSNDTTKHNGVMWNCVCECGGTIKVASAKLKRGFVKSCGCLRRGILMSQSHMTHGRSKTHEFSMHRAAKQRAKEHQLPFNLELDDIIIPERCPVFPDIVLRINVDHLGDDSPTLDRLIPELGYIKGNVRVISCRANRIKNDATVAELRRVADWLEQELEV